MLAGCITVLCARLAAAARESLPLDSDGDGVSDAAPQLAAYAAFAEPMIGEDSDPHAVHGIVVALRLRLYVHALQRCSRQDAHSCRWSCVLGVDWSELGIPACLSNICFSY